MADNNELNIEELNTNSSILDKLKNFIEDPKFNPKNQNKYFFSDAMSYYKALSQIYLILKGHGDAFKMVWDNEKELAESIEGFISEEEVDAKILVLKNEILALLNDYATLEDLESKQDLLVSTINIKSINSKSIVGEGNVDLTASDIKATNTQTIQQNLERIDERIDDVYEDKQDVLIAGENIEITEDSQGRPVISATGDLSVDYSQITNKPSINGHTINGSMAGEDLGLVNEEDLENYITKEDAPGYADILTNTDAQSTYETQSHASSTYETKTNVNTLAGRVTTVEGDITEIDQDIIDLENGKQDKLSTQQISNINRALVTPVSTPTIKEIVGIGTDNSQIRIQLDEDTLEFDGTTSPFTLKAKPQSGAFSYVGMLQFNTLNTEAELQAIFGSDTSWSKLASKMPIGENVFGNGKTLGFTDGTIFVGTCTFNNGQNIRLLTGVYNQNVGEHTETGGGLTNTLNFGAPTKSQLDNGSYSYESTGLIMDSVTINIWKRTS